jgi:hypothetical protein
MQIPITFVFLACCLSTGATLYNSFENDYLDNKTNTLGI